MITVFFRRQGLVHLAHVQIYPGVLAGIDADNEARRTVYNRRSRLFTLNSFLPTP